ncbi:MAG: TerC family protein [Coriobacteriales bacterium]|nr:TerC family protein [Coriobacteriales bacterium]
MTALDLLSVFTTPDAWVTLAILIFLELVLGIDNLVFIAITTDRLPESKKKIGRRFGLGAALAMRILFLCFASWIVSLTVPLFTLPFALPGFDLGISGKDLILLIGGIYLIYKGILEIREKLSLKEERMEHGHPEAKSGQIGLAQAVGTIAVMDVVFSIDSVITAVGLAAGMLIVMIAAVMIAVFVMIIFADPISEFINSHPEMKILALLFIILVGIKLVIESFEIELLVEHTNIEVLDVALYAVMACTLILTVLQMTYSRRLAKMHAEIEAHAAQEPKDAE